MSHNYNSLFNNLFSSIISDIKSYNGNDPLLPWIRGIKRIKDSLPLQLLKEKLPRFLQKCAETFQTDRRYANDLRYLRVWLQLMDYVDDPKAVLRTMETNRIGMRKSLFYQAYALYYEKIKKFDAAEKIYHLGVQNLAEPADELQKAYEQFLHRMKRHRNKRIQAGKTNVCIIPNNDEVKEKNESACRIDAHPAGAWLGECVLEMQPKSVDADNKMNQPQSTENAMPIEESNHKHIAKSGNVELLNNELLKKVTLSDCGGKSNLEEPKVEHDGNRKFGSEDTVVVKFVGTAIVGRSNAEDTRHHGLVEPTINTKEAMNAINSMFREPLEPSIAGRTSDRSQPRNVESFNNEIKEYTDKGLETEVGSSQQKPIKDLLKPQPRSDSNQPVHEPFQIYIDDEESEEKESKVESSPEGVSHGNDFPFPIPNDLSDCTKDLDARRWPQAGQREDTVVFRFVGSTILDEPEVENVCHHGLVDPTINLKEAMNDINSMFGKPIEFARKSRMKKQDRITDVKNSSGGFLILPDDELENEKAMNDVHNMFQKPIEFSRKSRPNKHDDVPNHVKTINGSGFLILPDEELDNEQGNSLSSLSARNEHDLFEQTLCTKEAMAEISKMFAMPMDL
ncbi:Mad3/BUB1-like proteiny region 1 [Abeliophyllum distichum]|uniref:Mad3/BUB1-like proteiny region 1 n=1 Tax=Abeliophyllum distichum TaxID=126358 RepID=A0ABD1UNN9_9LAMI